MSTLSGLPQYAAPELYLSSWKQKDAKAVGEALRQIFDIQHTLQTAFSQLDISQEALSPKTQEAFATVETSVTRLEDHLRSMAAPVFFNERHSTLHAVPDNGPSAFRIAEMLENILAFLQVRDTLNMQQVNKATYTIVQGSQPLQRRLGLCVDTQSVLRLTLSTGPREALVNRYLHSSK